MSTLDAALELAGRGWHVLPLAPGTKLPATAHGFMDATTDDAIIRSWWERAPYNLGIRTGAVSGIVVLDVDPPDGFTSLARLEAQHGRLPWGARVSTPRRGLHIYFAHPGGHFPNSAGKLGKGLDVRGDGGYVVAPPSVLTGGGGYRWTGTGALPPCPLRPPAPPQRPQTSPRPLVVVPGGRYAQAALRGELERVRLASVGQRNHTLYLAALKMGSLVGAGALDGGFAARALLDVALEAGLGEKESRATILSGLNAGDAHPRHGVSA